MSDGYADEDYEGYSTLTEVATTEDTVSGVDGLWMKFSSPSSGIEVAIDDDDAAALAQALIDAGYVTGRTADE